MKKITIFIIMAIVLISLSGCGNNTNSEMPNNENTGQATGNYAQIFAKLNTDMNYDDIKKVIGVDGKQDSIDENRVRWYFDDNNVTKIEVLFSDETSKKYTKILDLVLRYDKNDLKNSNVDFSNFENVYNDQYKKLTYDYVSSAFKTNGTLIKQTSTGTKIYVWVDSNGKSVEASFTADGTSYISNRN